MNSLTVRIISAVSLIACLALVQYFVGSQGVLVLGFFLIGLAIYEYAQMHFALSSNRRTARILFTFAALFTIVQVLTGHFSAHLFAFCLALLFCVFIWLVRGESQNDRQLRTLSELALGVIYLGLFPGLGLRLLKFADTEKWFWFMVALVAAGDIAGYFVGRAFGRRALLKSMSPNKTVEGFVGALISSLLISFLFHYFFATNVEIWKLLLAGPMISFFAQTGDLFESLLKRTAGVKDSGKILPGHGGLLDRIDGHIFACPVVYFAYTLLS